MAALSWLDAISRAAGLDATTATEPLHLFGLFQKYRPNGAGIDPLIKALPHGEPLLARLHRLYARTASSFRASDTFFVPRATCSADQAVELATRHARSFGSLLRNAGFHEVGDVLSTVTARHAADRTLVQAVIEDQNALDCEVRSIVADIVSELDSGAERILRDAFYSVAADYFVGWYLSWPIYKGPPHPDPFEPYFDLWSYGAIVAFTDDECLVA